MLLCYFRPGTAEGKTWKNGDSIKYILPVLYFFFSIKGSKAAAIVTGTLPGKAETQQGVQQAKKASSTFREIGVIQAPKAPRQCLFMVVVGQEEEGLQFSDP